MLIIPNFNLVVQIWLDDQSSPSGPKGPFRMMPLPRRGVVKGREEDFYIIQFGLLVSSLSCLDVAFLVLVGAASVFSAFESLRLNSRSRCSHCAKFTTEDLISFTNIERLCNNTSFVSPTSRL